MLESTKGHINYPTCVAEMSDNNLRDALKTKLTKDNSTVAEQTITQSESVGSESSPNNASNSCNKTTVVSAEANVALQSETNTIAANAPSPDCDSWENIVWQHERESNHAQSFRQRRFYSYGLATWQLFVIGPIVVIAIAFVWSLLGLLSLAH